MKKHILVALLGVLCVLGTPVSEALAGFAGTDVFLPMVGRNVGVYPSNWYTTVWIYNPGAAMVTARLYFLERSKVNLSAPWVDVTVAAGATEKLENPVEVLFHLQVFGAIRVTAPEKIVVTSRVYSKVEGTGERESMGQDFAAVPASFAIGLNEKSQILGCHQTLPTADSEYRYNFGLVEATGHTATVKVTARDENGVEQGTTSILVREYSQKQMAFKDYFPTLSTENTRLEIEVTSGSGKVIGYGSGVANGSQDPTTYEMTYRDSLLGMLPVQHDATLVGDGTAAALLGLADGAVSKGKLGASGGTAGQVLGTTGSSLQWQDDGLKLPYSGTASTSSAAFTLSNSGSGGMGLQITSASGAPGANAPTVFAQNTASGTMGWLADRERGVWGMSPTGTGVVGYSQANGYGVFGVLGSMAPITPLPLGGVAGSSTSAAGVVGTSNAAEGVHGKSALGDGVLGEASAASKSGVYGMNPNPSGWAGFFAGRVGVTGGFECTGCVTKSDLSAPGGTSGQVLGTNGGGLVWQNAASGDITAVTAGAGLTGGGTSGDVTLGIATPLVLAANTIFEPTLSVTNAGTGGAVKGTCETNCSAVVGNATTWGSGVYGSVGGATSWIGGVGVQGYANLGVGRGVFGSGGYAGVDGNSSSGFGVLGGSSTAVGVMGTSVSSDGVFGWSDSGRGVHGQRGSFDGYLGYSDGAVLGTNGTNYGYLGRASEGVFGQAVSAGGYGVHGASSSGDGVFGEASAANKSAVYAVNPSGWAGTFNGNVQVNGDLSATGNKAFVIDHPLDPANRELRHAAIESDEVLDVYSGNVTTDADGLAVVRLPDWFEALNSDYRYQLTCIGRFAQAIVEREIDGNSFSIRTNLGGVKVSWLVNARRNDAWMRAHPFLAERDKPQAERGTYLAPLEHGQPEEKGVEWARHPETMQRMKERREAAEHAQAATPDAR